MGPLFVLIIWATVAGILSVIGGLILAGLVALLTRRVKSGRRRAIRIGGGLPAAGFAYLFVCVLIFSIWSAARGRDWGWGDTWDTPILGPYHLMMIDITDKGTIYNRADPNVYQQGSVIDAAGRKDVVFGVRRLEVRPPYLIGAASPESFMQDSTQGPETLFFILDTRTGSRIDVPSLAALEATAAQTVGRFQLKPVNEIYNQYRYSWLDVIPLGIFAVPPFVTFFLLGRGLIRLRRDRQVLGPP